MVEKERLEGEGDKGKIEREGEKHKERGIKGEYGFKEYGFREV